MSVRYGLTFGRTNFVSMKWSATTSSGCPSFSYMARKKSGSMTIIMPIAARDTFPSFLSRKKDGTPMSAAAPKQMSCLFVRLKTSFDLTRVRSREIGRAHV